MTLWLLNVELASGNEVFETGALNFYFPGASCFT